MIRAGEFAAPAAATVVVLTALLGGGFFPLPRMIVGGALLVVWIFAAMGSRGGLDRTEWLLVGFVGWGLFSAIWVGSSPLAAKETLTIWIIAGLLFGICRRGGDDSRWWAIDALVSGALVVAVAVLVEAMSQGLRVGGFFENPNVAAGVLVPTLPMGWWILDRAPRWRWVWSVIVTAGIIGTGSRAGLLAVVVVVGLLLPRGRLRLVGLIAGSIMTSAVLVVRFAAQPDVLAWHRISIWWAVVKIWLTRPLTGVGPGCLAEAATAERILHPDEIGRYQFVIGYAESTPLAILVQIGLIGLILACLAAGSWWSSTPRLRANRSGALKASLAAAMILALFHDLLTIDPVLWWWAVLAGCAGAVARVDETETSATDRSVVVRWFASIVITWVTAWGIVSPAYAKWVWQRHEPTTDHVIRTLRIEPWLAVAPAGRVHILLTDRAEWTWPRAAEALHWARVTTDLRPGAARGWADLGRVHLRLISDLGGTDHDIVTAKRAQIRACELDPRLPWHWLERARLERLTGNLDEAVRFTRYALQQEPNTVRGWLFLSRIEFESGKLDSSRAAYDEALKRIAQTEAINLNEYERELVLAPEGQLEALRVALYQRALPGDDLGR